MQRIETGHSSFIHCLSYDFYGKRLATCSADQTIKIWKVMPNGEWVCESSCEAHSASVSKLSWAHPEFGQILASGSADKKVIIWVENKHKWDKKIELTDFLDTVTDIKFAPHQFGLKIAACSLDGFVRIYEAMDVINLEQWSVIFEFEIGKPGERLGVTSLSWRPYTGVNERSSLAVGGKDGIIKIWEEEVNKMRYSYEVNKNKMVNDVSWAPNLGRQFELIASASENVITILKLVKVGDKWQQEVSEVFHKGVWTLEWNITGTILASSGDDGKIRLWRNRNNTWEEYKEISN